MIHPMRTDDSERESIVGKTWYCPNGCQAFTPSLPDDGPPECGSCGREMTTSSHGFDAVHEAIEQEGIAEMTHRLRADSRDS